MVCYDVLGDSNHACDALSCHHVCCDDCLLRHVEAQLEEGRSAGCPYPNCSLLIPEAVLTALLSKQGTHGINLLTRARKLRAYEFADQCDRIKWCPRPGCKHTVKRCGDGDGGAFSTVTCACGATFCFGCLFLGCHE